MESFDAKHSGVYVPVRLQEFREHASRNIMAARESEVRMPRSQFGLDPNLKRGFLDAFVQLKKVRMRRADADPNDFHATSRWKCSNALDRQKKRAELDRIQFLAQRKIDILGNVGEKAEREMHLIASCPTNAANLRIKTRENLSNRLRRID